MVELLWRLGVLREEARQRREQDGEQPQERAGLKEGQPCPVVWIWFTGESKLDRAFRRDFTTGVDR